MKLPAFIFGNLLSALLIYDAVIGKNWSLSEPLLIGICYFALVINTLCVMSESAIAYCRKTGRYLPAWISNTLSLASVLFLLYHGWIVTGIVMLISKILEILIFDVKSK